MTPLILILIVMLGYLAYAVWLGRVNDVLQAIVNV